ncbi:MAG: patatin-like phospholipase family protein, partial [Clostridiaceae bacterium]|nr:patatin-like phospholipase family protein [Clostridiaceae bacterium]
MSEVALALGGGGSKGMFQMGAWKAFRQLGLDFAAISGTSIGAVNGALMLGTPYDQAMEMWANLTIDQCLAFSERTELRSEDLLSLKNAELLAKELWNSRSLNTAPLRDLLNKYVNEKNIRASKADFGVMTTVVPDFKPHALWLDEVSAGSLIEYIMASARLPGLAPVRIDGTNYMDGGILENVPVSMLRRRGHRQIVAVDLEPKASVLSRLDDNVQLTLIHDKQSLGGFLDLTPAVLRRNFRLGYLDTMKAFARLNGEYYSFRNEDYQELLRRFGFETVSGLEQAALIYEIDRCCIYKPDDFITEIRRKRTEFQMAYEEKRKALKIEHKLKALASGKLRVLNLLPPLQLAFLMEVKAEARQNGTVQRLPIRLFAAVDDAANALSQLNGLI